MYCLIKRSQDKSGSWLLQEGGGVQAQSQEKLLLLARPSCPFEMLNRNKTKSTRTCHKGRRQHTARQDQPIPPAPLPLARSRPLPVQLIIQVKIFISCNPYKISQVDVTVAVVSISVSVSVSISVSVCPAPRSGFLCRLALSLCTVRQLLTLPQMTAPKMAGCPFRLLVMGQMWEAGSRPHRRLVVLFAVANLWLQIVLHPSTNSSSGGSRGRRGRKG